MWRSCIFFEKQNEDSDYISFYFFTAKFREANNVFWFVRYKEGSKRQFIFFENMFVILNTPMRKVKKIVIIRGSKLDFKVSLL